MRNYIKAGAPFRIKRGERTYFFISNNRLYTYKEMPVSTILKQKGGEIGHGKRCIMRSEFLQVLGCG